MAQVKLTNLITDGSFENTGWNGGTYDSSVKKYGTYSYKVASSASVPETLVRTTTGYKQLEYIEKSAFGSEYIDTGFQPKNTTRVVMNFYIPQNPNSTDYITIFGGRTANGSASFTLWQQEGTKFRSDFAGSNSSLTPTRNYGHFIVDKNKKTTTLTDVDSGQEWSSTVNTSTTFTSNSNLTIFALNSGGSIDSRDANGMILYSCQVYDNGNLIRDFVPCQRTSDSVVGLYDIVNNTFYGPTGSGSFIGGPSIIAFNGKGKISGSWKELTAGYSKINGVWKVTTGINSKITNNWKA